MWRSCFPISCVGAVIHLLWLILHSECVTYCYLFITAFGIWLLTVCCFRYTNHSYACSRLGLPLVIECMKRNEKYWLNPTNLSQQMSSMQEAADSWLRVTEGGLSGTTMNAFVQKQTSDKWQQCELKRIYPWNSEVCHQLLKGPRLLCLLLVVQRYLLAELPGVWATCARGARHGAGRRFTTSATWGEKSGRRCSVSILQSLSMSHAGSPLESLKHSRHYWSSKVNSKSQLACLRCDSWVCCRKRS